MNEKSNILDISTLMHCPSPSVSSQAMPMEESMFCISFLLSLNTQIACSTKRGQKNRRIPSNNKNKQEAHGPHRSPEKQFQSINTFAQSIDYAITLREKIIISILIIDRLIIYKNLNSLHAKIQCAKFCRMVL